jgi:hypothetical protein
MWRAAIVAIVMMSAGSGQTRSLTKLDSWEAMYDSATACPSTWSHQGLLGAVFHPGTTDGPLLWRLKNDGNLDYTPFLFPGGRYYSIAGVAERPDGDIEVAGTAAGEDGKPIHFIAQSGRNTTIVITTPYQPAVMTVAPDGVVWTIGSTIMPGHRFLEYNVLKRFNRMGNLLSTSILKVRGKWGADAALNSILRASNDRVGWLTIANEYLEFSLDGQEITHINGPPGRAQRDELWTSFVLSPANEVVVSLPADYKGSTLNLWTLDRRAKMAWSAIESDDPPERAHLFGFDGGYVIASDLIALPGATPRQALSLYEISVP